MSARRVSILNARAGVSREWADYRAALADFEKAIELGEDNPILMENRRRMRELVESEYGSED